MIGVAAGMSATGLIPFVHSFGTFVSRRVMDQVFVSAAFAQLNIRIIGSDPGVVAATNGGTHMPLEDIGMMRSIPNITILEPTDTVMLVDLIRQVKDRYGTFYIRLARRTVEDIFVENSHFEIGKAVKILDGNDLTIFASGVCVPEAIVAAQRLKSEGIQATVSNMFTIKPIDIAAVEEAAKKTGAVVTVENHNIIGGLGSAVAEALGETIPVPLERVGVRDRFGEVGSFDYLKEIFHICADDIVEAAKRVMKRK
jgi:transketolase